MPTYPTRIALVALGLLCLTSPVSATATAMNVEISIEPEPAHEGGYKCVAVIRDAANGEVLSAPTITFIKGEEARVTSGLPDGSVVRLTVFVTADGTEARYRTEIRDGDVVQTSQQATIRL